MHSETADFVPGSTTWRTEQNMLVVFDSGLFTPLYGVHNVFHCRRRRTELRPQVTLTEKLVKFGRVVYEVCKWTDKQTDTQARTYTLITILRSPTGDKIIMIYIEKEDCRVDRRAWLGRTDGRTTAQTGCGRRRRRRGHGAWLKTVDCQPPYLPHAGPPAA